MTVHELLEALGYPHTMYDGEYRWSDSGPPEGLVEMLASAISGNFLALDIEGAGMGKSICAMATASRSAALKALQCSEIRRLRSAAYKEETDELFFGSEADGDNRNAWLAKRAEIKARFPWPGTYR
jgi:hypothetical protein